MKSPAIFQNKKSRKGGSEINFKPNGFLIMEALIAMALMTLLVPAAFALSWSNNRLKIVSEKLLNSVSTIEIADLIENGAAYQIASSSAQYQHEFAKNTCSLIPRDKSRGFIGADIYETENEIQSETQSSTSQPLDFTVGAVGTSLAAHNGFIYETTVPASRKMPDFFIIDDRNPSAPILVSSLVTGPGLAGVTVSGYYAYVANESTQSQLRIIDMHNRSNPVIISQLKLPLPEASSTPPLAASLFYDDGFIYLGTQKWDGDEFAIINVTNPTSPIYVNGFNTDSLVNFIFENNGRAYLAMPLTNAQLDIFDVGTPNSIIDLAHFAPAGSAVLEGKTFEIGNSSTTADTLYFGRAGGGFNNSNQYELFSFNLQNDQYAQNPTFVQDIPGGVYGIVYSSGYVFLATGDSNAGFQIWKSDFSKEIFSAKLSSKPVSLVCDQNRLYATLSNPAGFAAIIPY